MGGLLAWPSDLYRWHRALLARPPAEAAASDTVVGAPHHLVSDALSVALARLSGSYDRVARIEGKLAACLGAGLAVTGFALAIEDSACATTGALAGAYTCLVALRGLWPIPQDFPKRIEGDKGIVTLARGDGEATDKRWALAISVDRVANVAIDSAGTKLAALKICTFGLAVAIVLTLAGALVASARSGSPGPSAPSAAASTPRPASATTPASATATASPTEAVAPPVPTSLPADSGSPTPRPTQTAPPPAGTGHGGAMPALR